MGRAARIKRARQETRRPSPAEAQEDATNAAYARLVREVRQDLRVIVVDKPADMPAASDRVEVLIEPALRLCAEEGPPSLAELTGFFLLGALAWNLQVLTDEFGCEPPTLRAQLVACTAKLLDDLELLGPDEAPRLAEELVARKRALFPDDRRLLVRTVVVPGAPGWSGVSVASTESRGLAARKAVYQLSATAQAKL